MINYSPLSTTCTLTVGGTATFADTLSVSGDTTFESGVVKKGSGGYYLNTSAGAFRAAFWDNGSETRIFADGNGSTAAIVINNNNATFAGDVLTSGNIYLNNNKSIFAKNTSGSNYGLLTITSGNVVKLGAYAYTSAATEIGLGNNGKFLIGTAEALSIDNSKNATFAGTVTATGGNISSSVSGGDSFLISTSASTTGRGFIKSIGDTGAVLFSAVYGSASTGSIFGTSLTRAAAIVTTSDTSVHPTSLLVGTFTGIPLIFGTNNVERLKIDSSGNATFAGNVTTSGTKDLTVGGTIYVNNVQARTSAGLKVGNDDFSGFVQVADNGQINLDAGNSEIHLIGNGTLFGKFFKSGDNLYINQPTQDKDIIFSGNDGGSSITALTLDMSDSGKATFNNGWSSDGQATEYTWRIPNTGSNDGHWYKIARVTSIQSTRFKLQMVGGHSYSDGYYSSEVNAYGQLNNDNNYDLIFHKLEADNQGGDPIISFGQVDIDTSSTDLYVRLNTFAELVITASISNGNLYPDDTSTGSSTTPTNFVAALEQFGVLSPTIFQSTVRLDSQLLDGTNDAGTSGQILSSTGSVTNWIDVPDTGSGVYLPLAGGTMNSGATIGMTGSLTIDGGGSSTDVLKLKGSARIQIENASGNDSFYISNTGGSGASTLDLGGALSLVENGNATFAGDVIMSKNAGPTLNMNTNLAGNTSKILLHEGTTASPANGASIRYDGSANTFKIGVGSNVDTTRLTIDRGTGLATFANNVSVTGNVGIGNPSVLTHALNINVPSGTTKGIYFMDSGNDHYGTKIQYTEATNIFSIIQEENNVQTGSFSIERANGNATFSGIVGMGSTGIYAGTNAQLNLPGKGLAIKNDKSGSNNNWSYIENTATGSSSNINFHTGNNTAALTLAHNGAATFAGNIITSGELTINNNASDNNKGIHIKNDTDAYGGGITFWTEYSGTDTNIARVQGGTNGSNGILYLQTANTSKVLTTALSLDFNQNAVFTGNVTIPSYVYHSGDPNTYFGFGGADAFRVVAGGSEKLHINTSGLQLGGTNARVSTIYDQDDMSSNSATALATQQSIKAYVDNSISGGANYLGVWDPDDSLNNGYGNPSLQASTRTDDSGDYFICSADGAAHPNGGTTEPDSWHVGDWVIWNEDLGSSGLWQKIDNTTVLSGGGTANKVAKFTDNETIGDGPITFSGNNSIFTGDITSTGLTVDYTGNRTGDAGILVTNDASDWGIKVDKDGTADYGILSQTDGDNAIVVRNAAGTTKIQLQGDGDATFAGNISAGSGTFSAFVYAEDEIHLTDAGTTRAKLLLNSSDRDNVELRAESLGSTMKFFTVGTEALELDASQNATFAGNITFGDSHFIGDDADDNLLIESSTNENVIINSPDDDVLIRTAGTTRLQITNTLATFAGKIIAGQGVQFTGGTIAAATTVLHTNNVVYARGGSGGMFLQNADGSDGMFIANDHVRIETGSSERMRIIANGNVGIGTNVPSTFLQVSGQGNRAGGNIQMGLSSQGASKWSYLTGTHYNSTTEPEGFALIGGYSDIDENRVVIGGDIWETNPSTSIHFWTHSSSTHAQGGSERMRINSAGALIINGTAVRESASKFSVQGGMSEFETTLSNNDDWQNSPISILERANIGSGSTADKYAPNLNFHWSAVSSNSLWMGANGNLNYGSYSGAGTPAVNGTFATGNLVAASAITGSTGAFTGQVTGPTPSTSTSFANKAYVDAHVSPAGTYLPLAGGTMTGTTRHGDDVVSYWGTGDDLEIYHNSSGDSVIQNHVGDLYFTNKADDKDIIFRTDDGLGGFTEYFRLDGGESNTIFSRDLKFLDSGLPSRKLIFGTNNDLQMFHDGSNSYIAQGGAGDLYIQQNVDDKDLVFQCDNGSGGTTAYFYLDGSLKLNRFLTHTLYNDNVEARFGTNTDLKIYHNASSGNNNIDNINGDLYMSQYANDKDIIFRSDNGSGGVEEYFRVDGSSRSIVVSAALGVYHNDGVASRFGNAGDLQIYHNATNSIISNATGNLYIKTTGADTDIVFEADDGSGGAVAEYFRLDGSFEKTVFSKDIFLNDSVKALFGNSSDLQIYHNGSNNISFITNSNASGLRLQSDELRIFANNGTTIRADFNTAVKLYYNDSKKFETSNAGVSITGSLSTTQDISVSGDVMVTGTTTAGGTLICEGNITVQDSDKLQLGNSQDLELYHASGVSYIDNDTGHLYIRNNVDNDDGSNIYIQAKSGEHSILCQDDGAVSLYNNNVQKFSTNSTGAGAYGYIGFGSAGTSTGSTYGFRYGSSSPNGSQGIVITVSDTGGSYFDGVGRFQNTNTGQGAGMFQMVNYGSLYGRYMQFFRGSTSNIIGYIGYNSSNTSVTFSTTNSDIRTKKNITAWDENVLDKFKALQPKRFDFKVAIGDKGAVKERGFIAQYEKDNFPEAYQLNGNDEKATYGFHPMEMVPYMMKAIKDLTIKNEELERRIKTLES